MKVELRKFKHYPSMSEETECFIADLYVDGKKIGVAENSGKGGCNDTHVFKREDWVAFAQFVKAQPPVVSPLSSPSDTLGPTPMAMTEDLFISLLVEAELVKRDNVKKARRHAKLKAKAEKYGGVAFVITYATFAVEGLCKREHLDADVAKIKAQRGADGVLEVLS